VPIPVRIRFQVLRVQKADHCVFLHVLKWDPQLNAYGHLKNG